MFRKAFFVGAPLCAVSVLIAALRWPVAAWAFLLIGPLVLVGLHDVLQRRHSLLRVYPIIGHGRYLMETFRPELQQYFVESNIDGTPFSREFRSIVYQRAKGEIETLPFGTQRDVQRIGYEWINHSLAPKHVGVEACRIAVGGPHCTQPYLASYLNISAMSFGALSGNAILALNQGARLGGFAHNTGEGGVSDYHLEPGGDLIWQIGTGYFGCRTSAGDFDPHRFQETAGQEAVKMIEIKLSQGAKPGHGGILPAAKLTREIAAIRGVPMGEDVISPPAHTAFHDPVGLIEFVALLRDLSGGKPVGFKLCIGQRSEFLGICKAILETGVAPDFITVDGAEGGTGAAPIELSNSVGTPLRHGLVFVHNSLRGIGVRSSLRVIAAGKVTTGFHMFRNFALGADLCNAARAMMFALGCIQARRCNDNSCPVGVATQDPARSVGLDVRDKSRRVARYHEATVKAFCELVGTAGLSTPLEIQPHHLFRQIDALSTKHFGDLYSFPPEGFLIDGAVPAEWAADWNAARPGRFAP